jgi:hypothetical protein
VEDPVAAKIEMIKMNTDKIPLTFFIKFLVLVTAILDIEIKLNLFFFFFFAKFFVINIFRFW